MQLHEFLTSNRLELIRRCQEDAARRFTPTNETEDAIIHGVPLFLEQLIDTLRGEQNTNIRSGADSETPAIDRSATLHGAELLRGGFKIDQVVYAYGDVCQCMTTLAVEQEVSISTDEFRTFDRCLGNAIAAAVTSFMAARQTSIERQTETWQQRLDDFAAEHRRLFEIAIRSFIGLQTGNIETSEATDTFDNALEKIRCHSDRSLPQPTAAYRSLPQTLLTSRAPRVRSSI